MATSDSGDEREFGQPTRKKRRAAQAAESKFHELGTGKLSHGTGGEEIDEPSPVVGIESAPAKRNLSGSRSESGKGVVGETSRRLSSDDDDSGQEHDEYNEEIMDSDADDDGDTFESDADDDRPSKSASTSKSRRQKNRSSSTVDYHDFAPPPFLQKILSKRQREMDNIRRQLPVDSRSREQKLADWYRMLSKLDKPVALLSLISPPQQD